MFVVRSICAFVTISPSDVADLSSDDLEQTKLFSLLSKVSEGLLKLKEVVEKEGYVVQTVR
jgi:hypothetical protein